MPSTVETIEWYDGDAPRIGQRVVETRNEPTGLVDKEGKPTFREVAYVAGSVDWPVDVKTAKKMTKDQRDKHYPEWNGKVSESLKDVDTVLVSPEKTVWTAELIAKNWAAAEIKAIAKERGLSVSGGEVVVAQRLLDSGWLPK